MVGNGADKKATERHTELWRLVEVGQDLELQSQADNGAWITMMSLREDIRGRRHGLRNILARHNGSVGRLTE